MISSFRSCEAVKEALTSSFFTLFRDLTLIFQVPGSSSAGASLSVAQHQPSARGQLAQREPQLLQCRQSGSSQSGAVPTWATEKPTNRRRDVWSEGVSSSQYRGVSAASRDLCYLHMLSELLVLAPDELIIQLITHIKRLNLISGVQINVNINYKPKLL